MIPVKSFLSFIYSPNLTTHNESSTLLLLSNFHFNSIAVSEFKLHKDLDPTVNIDIEGYNKPLSCPTDASKGGVVLYSSNKINIIPRNKL